MKPLFLIALLLSACTPPPEPALPNQTTFVYKTVAGHAIHAEVHRTDREGPAPAILWLHGGGLMFGARHDLREEQRQAYLDAGYTVFALDYRLAPEAALPEIVADVEDGYRWLREDGPHLFGIDPDRIAVVGHSAGAYLALHLGHRADPSPAALVSFYGYGEITGPWYTAPSPFYSQGPPVSAADAAAVARDTVVSSTRPEAFDERFQAYLYSRQQGTWPQVVARRDPTTEAEWFAAYEPIRHLTPAFPPTLLLHGPPDFDVPFAQAERLRDSLAHHGVPNHLLTNENWGHGFDGAGFEDTSVRDAFAQVLAFLDAHL